MATDYPQLRARRSLAAWAILALALVGLTYVITLLIAVGCVYGPYRLFLVFPRFQTLVLLFGGIIIAAVILWSLVPRRDWFQAPGPRLPPEEHPRLFAELSTIASALQEPMPGEVYLIPDMNAWVAQRGGILGFGSRRVMGLGLPLMSILTVSQFRAVLAHEFGHYYSGDTRLWPWVHKTREAMARTLANLGSDSMASAFAKLQLAGVVHGLAVAAIGSYWKLFMRLSQAISRRHEYRADELASSVSGPQALIDGLKAIRAASAALPAFWQSEFMPAMAAGCRPPITAGFAYFIGVPHIAKALTAYLDAELRKGTTNPYDTHPALRDRIAALTRYAPGAPETDNTAASALLDRIDGVETQLIGSMLPEAHSTTLRPVPWERIGSEVYAPAWKTMAGEYSSVMGGYTVGQLPEVVARLPEMASQIRNPRGMLLTREQGLERAVQILWRTLAVALWEHAWQFHTAPGEFFLMNGEHRINPAQLIGQLRFGVLNADGWRRLAMDAGIAEMSLAPAPKVSAASPTTPD